MQGCLNVFHHLKHLCVKFLAGIREGRSSGAVHRDLVDLFVIVQTLMVSLIANYYFG